MNKKQTFIDLMSTACAIEIGGNFVRYFDGELSDDSDEPAYYFYYTVESGEHSFCVSHDQLEDVDLDEEGGTWRVAGYAVSFYSVSRIDTSPV